MVIIFIVIIDIYCQKGKAHVVQTGFCCSFEESKRL